MTNDTNQIHKILIMCLEQLCCRQRAGFCQQSVHVSEDFFNLCPFLLISLVRLYFCLEVMCLSGSKRTPTITPARMHACIQAHATTHAQQLIRGSGSSLPVMTGNAGTYASCLPWQGSIDLVTIRLRPSCSHVVSVSKKTSHRESNGGCARSSNLSCVPPLPILFVSVSNFLGYENKIARAK